MPKTQVIFLDEPVIRPKRRWLPLAVTGGSIAGPFGPTVGGDVVNGDRAWSNPGNITAEDGTCATAAFGISDADTDYLTGEGFGFSVPGGATINGIKVEWKVKTSATGHNSRDENVKIIKADVISGTNKANGANWTASLAYQVYGGPTDLWGLSWTPANINDPLFGAALSAQCDVNSLVTLSVDYVRITVCYTIAGFTAKSRRSLSPAVGKRSGSLAGRGL